MIAFLKRWYREFKNEQALKNPLQSTMMTKEEVSEQLNNDNDRVFDFFCNVMSTAQESAEDLNEIRTGSRYNYED
ncbi:hypothetical protein [Photobacterium leiognathi]|uniref:hypothetical protein n=1 Tax=Photobacterium leiognathi TaxID=553611 RepID=UPI0029813969|nr:hypothetical protein [Photobacterium leiognathi]